MEIGAETPHDYGKEATEVADAKITDGVEFWKVEPGSPRPSWVEDTFQEEGLAVDGNEVLRVLLEDGEEVYVHPGDYLFRYGDGDYRAIGKGEYEQGREAFAKGQHGNEFPQRPPSHKELLSQYLAKGYVMSRKGALALAEALAEGLSDEARETVAENAKAAFVDQKLFPQEECFGIVSDALQNHRHKADKVEDYLLVDTYALLSGEEELPDWVERVDPTNITNRVKVKLSNGEHESPLEGETLVLFGSGDVWRLDSKALEEGSIFSEKHPETAATVRREGLKRLWAELGELPFEEDKDGVLHLMFDSGWKFDKFGHEGRFYPGQAREEIWRWFDDRYPGGVHALMFPSEHVEQAKVPVKKETPKTPDAAEREARRTSAGGNAAKRGPVETEQARRTYR